MKERDFWAIALCQFKLGRRVAETCRDMVAAFGDEAPAERTVQKWFLEFQSKDMKEKMDGAAPIYFPFGNRYYKIDKRYRFTQRTNLMPLTANYPLRGGYPFDTEYGNREVHPHQRQFFKANNAPSNVEVMFQADIFPDSILMTIFKYMHPVDLINGVSGVSRRWNKLANAPSNYTSVRVIIDEDSVTTGSAKAFLQRGSNYIRKLCLDYAKNISPGCFSHILPECMPNVTLLDISFIADFDTNVDALIRCFPNVEILRMESFESAAEKSLTKLFSEHAFPRVRKLYFGSLGFIDPLLRKLFVWNRPIEVLALLDRDETDFTGLQRAPFIPTLTEFYFENVVPTDSAYARIGRLRNLKKLSIRFWYDEADEKILHLKNLSNLEHLHMYCLGEGTEHSSARTAELFRLPDENASKFFPYRLKHLRITNNPNFRSEAIEELAKSCPDLESLNVSYDDFVNEEVFAMIAHQFKNLRFLEASGLNSSFDVLRQLSDDDLPNLKFLALRNTQTSQKVLEELNEKRPKLVITNRRNYFINGVIQDGKAYINKEFLGDINAVLNDFSEIDGFCCMGSVCSEYEDFIGD